MAAANASGFQRSRSVFWLLPKFAENAFFSFWHARYFYAEFLKLWSAFLFIALSWTLSDCEPGPGLAWPSPARSGPYAAVSANKLTYK